MRPPRTPALPLSKGAQGSSPEALAAAHHAAAAAAHQRAVNKKNFERELLATRALLRDLEPTLRRALAIRVTRSMLVGGGGSGSNDSDGDGDGSVDGDRVCVDGGSGDEDAGLKLALSSRPVPLLVRRVVATLVRTPPLLVCAYDDGRGLLLSARSIIYVKAPFFNLHLRPVTVDGDSVQETEGKKVPSKVKFGAHEIGLFRVPLPFTHTLVPTPSGQRNGPPRRPREVNGSFRGGRRIRRLPAIRVQVDGGPRKANVLHVSSHKRRRVEDCG